MPDPQPSKRVPFVSSRRLPEAEPVVPYAELHCCTNYSFLEGASHPDELVARAAELGYAALAITDRASLAGVVRAHVAARAAGLKLVIGAAVAPIDAAPLLLWATDRAAYGRLATLLTIGRRAAPKGEYRLSLADVAAQSAGLLAGVLPGQAGPGRSSHLEQLRQYREIFGDRCYALAELHRGQEDRGDL
jgi:error-prone DNA polymerase